LYLRNRFLSKNGSAHSCFSAGKMGEITNDAINLANFERKI